MSQRLVFRRLRVYEDGVLLALRSESREGAFATDGVVDAIAVGQHVIARVEQVVQSIALEDTGPFGPLSGDAAMQVDVLVQRERRGHEAAPDAPKVGTIEIALAIVVGEHRTVDFPSEIVSPMHERPCRTLAGKEVVTASAR